MNTILNGEYNNLLNKIYPNQHVLGQAIKSSKLNDFKGELIMY